MCGICGIIHLKKKPVAEHDVVRMMQKIRHRGPDDKGLFVENNVGLGFQRLAILDLSAAGHQPMFSNDGKYVIVFNGEIFNYVELKAELRNAYEFKSGTDTEVILAAYQVWGEACLNKFNGMFAFAILNRETGEVFIARDRFGIKPFYYYKTEDVFIFASEIKAILPLLKDVRPKHSIVYDYLRYNRTDHTENTFFEGIFKLQHGSTIKISNGNVAFNRWYVLSEKVNHKPINAEEYKALLMDAIKLRLRSDVPLGVCLSGGIDSSAIASVLVKEFGLTELNTFSAVYGKNEPTDESKFIDEFKPFIKNMYYTSPSAETFFNDYERFIEAHNEPVPDTSPYVQFKVMELAKEHVTVTIDGQGADEQLGGYHYFFGSYNVELLRKFKIPQLIAENYHYIKNHHSLNSLKYFAYYMAPSSGQKFIDYKRTPSLSKRFVGDMESSSGLGEMLYKPTSLQQSFLQHFDHKLEHLLRWEDLNAMHFSIEARVPFLDYRLVERTLSLPAENVIRKGTTKYILREALKGVLPDKIYHRKDKKGFSNPRDKWFRTPKFQELIIEILHSRNYAELGYFHPEMAQKRYQLHLEGKIDISKEIWKWVNMTVWTEKFVKGTVQKNTPTLV
jgi:asparagine synthase (glutamine-hydrolysing)